MGHGKADRRSLHVLANRTIASLPCRDPIEARYDNGLTLAIARTAAQETSLIVGFPKVAPLAAGEITAVDIQIDSATTRRPRAMALTSMMLTMKGFE